MNGVVVEISGREVAVLRDDGVVVKMKNYNRMLGEVVRVQVNTKRRKRHGCFFHR